MTINVNDVVQFTEEHEWCGCLGIVSEVKHYSNGTTRYTIGVPAPEQGVAFMMSMGDDIELVGKAVLGFDRSVVDDEDNC